MKGEGECIYNHRIDNRGNLFYVIDGKNLDFKLDTHTHVEYTLLYISARIEARR